MGCVTQIGEQGWNVGRMAVLAAGWPVDVSATTVDRQCGSSMQTNFNGAAAVMAGQLDLVVSAGVEMMSRVPMGSNGGSISEQVTDRYDIVMQGTSAELLAREWNLSREALDAYSLESHRRALAASDGGRFEREIVPIELPRRRRRERRSSRRGLDGAECDATAHRRRRGSGGLRGRRGAAARDDGRGARRAAAGVRSRRRDHRRQLVADRRRRGRRADRERAGGRAARPAAARAVRLVRDRRRRPDADAARQPAGDARRRSRRRG